MTLQDFLGTAQNQNMIVAGGLAFGEFQAYPVTLKPNAKGNAPDSEIRSVTAFFKIEGKIPNASFKELRKSLKPYGYLGYQGADYTTVLFTCSGGGLDLWNRLGVALTQLTNAFRMNGVGVPQTCAICRQPGCDSLAYVAGYAPVHAYCVENQSYQTFASTENNRLNGNYALGTIGAIIGALIGSIPTILLILLINRISAWLYALIPLVAYFGYKLLKGKMTKGVVIPVVIISSLLMVIVVELTVVFITVGREYGWMGVGEFLSLYFSVMSFGDILADTAMPLVFTGIGIFISWDQIRRSNVEIDANAELTLKSLFRKNMQSIQNTQNMLGMQNTQNTQNMQNMR